MKKRLTKKFMTKKFAILGGGGIAFLILFFLLGISVVTQSNGEKEIVYDFPQATGGGGQTVYAAQTYPVAEQIDREYPEAEQPTQSYPVADWTDAPELTDPNHMATEQTAELPFDPELCKTIQGPPCTLVRMPKDWKPEDGSEVMQLTDHLADPTLAPVIVGNAIESTDYDTWLQAQNITPETYNQWAHDTLGYDIPTPDNGTGAGGSPQTGGGAPPNDGTVYLWTDSATGGGNPNGSDINAGGGTNLGGGNPNGSDVNAGGGGGSDYAPNYAADIANGIYGGNANGTDSNAGGGTP